MCKHVTQEIDHFVELILSLCSYQFENLWDKVPWIVSRSILQGWDMSSIPIGDLEKMMANEGYGLFNV